MSSSPCSNWSYLFNSFFISLFVGSHFHGQILSSSPVLHIPVSLSPRIGLSSFLPSFVIHPIDPLSVLSSSVCSSIYVVSIYLSIYRASCSSSFLRYKQCSIVFHDSSSQLLDFTLCWWCKWRFSYQCASSNAPLPIPNKGFMRLGHGSERALLASCSFASLSCFLL